MGVIVLDLEFSATARIKESDGWKTKYEIIEIGAVKLNENNEVYTKFDTFVKPLYGPINVHVTALTGISMDMVEDAPVYNEAIKQFLDWVGEGEYVVYTWSDSDRFQFKNECRQKEFHSDRMDSLLSHWVDFQKLYGDFLGYTQQISLKNALGSAGIKFEGKMHSALADAMNTAELYRMMQMDGFKEKVEPLMELIRPKKELSFSLGSLISDEMLKEFCTG